LVTYLSHPRLSHSPSSYPPPLPHRHPHSFPTRRSSDLIAGYALARLTFRWAGLLGTAIFVTYLVPQTLLFNPLVEIIRDYHIGEDRKSTRLNSSHVAISYAVFCLKKKKKNKNTI